MKVSFKYGVSLGLFFIAHTILFYFTNPNLIFQTFSKLTYWYLVLYILFMGLAMYKNRWQQLDGGGYFKIAFWTYTIAYIMSSGFDHVFSNCLAAELNPMFLEEEKRSEEIIMSFFNESPLKILETIELLDDTIETHRTFTHFLSDILAAILLIAIPLSALLAMLGKRLLKKIS